MRKSIGEIKAKIHGKAVGSRQLLLKKVVGKTPTTQIAGLPLGGDDQMSSGRSSESAARPTEIQLTTTTNAQPINPERNAMVSARAATNSILSSIGSVSLSAQIES